MLRTQLLELIKNVFFEELKTKMLIFGDDLINLYECEKYIKKQI